MYTYLFWNRVTPINNVPASYFLDTYAGGDIILINDSDGRTVLIQYCGPPYYDEVLSHERAVSIAEHLLFIFNK